MASLVLTDDELDRMAERVAALVIERIERTGTRDAAPSGWLDTKRAAAYAGCTVHALHKATAAREVRFAQDGDGGKCWFRAPWIDAWREGREPDWT